MYLVFTCLNFNSGDRRAHVFRLLKKGMLVSNKFYKTYLRGHRPSLSNIT